jgi:multidrug transporter EmrE-like cation transporter
MKLSNSTSKCKYLFIVISVFSQCIALILVKLASETIMQFDPLAVILYALSIFFLLIQAIVWQQVLKIFDLFGAYLWMTLIYPLLFISSIVLFNEPVEIKTLASICLIISGIVIINWRGNE